MVKIITRTSHSYVLLVCLCAPAVGLLPTRSMSSFTSLCSFSCPCCSYSPSVPWVTDVIRTTFCLPLVITWLKLSEVLASHLRVLDLLWSSFGPSEICAPSTLTLNSVSGDSITESVIFSDKTQASLC